MYVQLLSRSAGRSCLVMASLFVAIGVGPGFAQAPATAPATRASQDEAVPVITVDEPVHDFGTVWVGPRLRHTFKITNAGNADLKITKLNTGCGCTVVGRYPKLLKPGESGEFPFVLNTNQVRGQYTKHPTIMSNDPATPVLKLTLKGEAKRRIEVTPYTAYFGAVYGNEPKTRILKIKNNLDTPLELALDPFASMGKFRFKLTETEPGQEFELEVSTVPPFEKFGMHQVTAVILTNQALMRQLQVRAMVAVKDRLDVQPTQLTLRPPPASQPSGQAPASPRRNPILTFTNYGETPVKVVEATVDDPLLKLRVQKYMGKAYRIYVDVPPDYVVPDEGRTITIKTDDAEKPVFEVPIKKLVQRPRTPRTPTKSPPAPAEMIVGQTVPDFTLTTVDGKTVSKDGKITVLNFYASKCPYCRKQLPRLDKMRADYEAKGVRFVNVVIPWRGAPLSESDEVAFLKKISVEGPLALDEGKKVGSLFKVGGVPSMAIVGKTGKVEAVTIGIRDEFEKRVKAQLDALVAGKPIPAEFLPEKQ